MRTPLLIVGLVFVAVGALWVGQGLSYVAWPQESFMISQPQWAWYGGALALAGIGLTVWSRR